MDGIVSLAMKLAKGKKLMAGANKKTNIPGTWPLGPSGIEVAMPAQHRLRLLKPAVGDRRRGIRDPGEAEVVFCAT